MKHLERYWMWIFGVVFSCGILYASVIRIPAIEKQVTAHETRICLLERMDTKLDTIIKRLPEEPKGKVTK